MRRLFGLFVVVLAVCPSVFGQGVRKDDIVINATGPTVTPARNATIRVCTSAATGTPCSPLASVFNDVGLTIPLQNPFTTDTNGNYHFYALSGKYQIQISGAGLLGTTTIPDVSLPADTSAVFPTLITQNLNNVVFADRASSLQACLTSAGANGTCYAPALYSTTLTASVTISTNNTTLRCEPGALITKSVAITLINITGTGDSVIGCNLNGAGLAGQAIILTGATNALIDSNVITNFGSTGFTGTILVQGGSNKTKVQNNRLSSLVETGIGVFAGVAANSRGTVIQGNYLDLTGSNGSPILAHSTNPGFDTSNMVIANNQMVTNVQFCVEVGPFGGATPADITIVGNNCLVMGPSANGGYSIAGVNQFIVNGNIFDANGQSVSIGGIEVASGSGGTVSGNAIFMSPVSTTLTGNCIGLGGGSVTLVSVSGNFCSTQNTSSVGSGIYLGSSVTSTLMQNNVISNNVVKIPTGSPSNGVWLQSNASGVVVSNNIISNNIVIGGGIGAGAAYALENDAGSVVNNTLSANFGDNISVLLNGGGVGVVGKTFDIANTNGGNVSVRVGGTFGTPTNLDSFGPFGVGWFIGPQAAANQSSLTLYGFTSGLVGINAPNVAGVNAVTLPAATGTVGLTTGTQTFNLGCNGTASPSATLFLVGPGQVVTTCTDTAGTVFNMVMASAGTIRNLRVKAGTGGVNASSGVFTLRKNGVDQSVTCTVGTGTSCGDTTNSFTVVAGDNVIVKYTTQAAETLANFGVAFEKQ